MIGTRNHEAKENWVRYPKAVDAKRHKSRQYINMSSGQVISHRKYQQLAAGGLRPEEVAKMRRVSGLKTPAVTKTKRFNAKVRALKRHNPKMKVRGDSPEAIKNRANIKRLLQIEDFDSKHKITAKNRGTDEERKLRELLEELGFRSEKDRHKVGESPPFEEFERD